MPLPFPPQQAVSSDSRAPLRIGFVSLIDAAPLIVAQELQFFARHDLRVRLHREIGWATIREKIIYGELDAAHALAPLLWSAQLGLGCPPCDVLTALVLNLNGNAITLSRRLWDAGVRDGATLREHVLARSKREPLTLGVVFPYSSHHLMLRDWLTAAGLRPDHDVRIVVVPPAQMFRNLAAQTIDGFCSGEPWNSLAVREGEGWCPTWSAALRPGHVEKVLMVTQRFATTRATEHGVLVRALLEACAWCDEPQNRERLAEIVASPRYLNLPLEVVLPSLADRFDCGRGRTAATPDFHVFHRGGANAPTTARAEALEQALIASGLVPADRARDADLPTRLFRDDLHRQILHQHPLPHEITV